MNPEKSKKNKRENILDEQRRNFIQERRSSSAERERQRAIALSVGTSRISPRNTIRNIPNEVMNIIDSYNREPFETGMMNLEEFRTGRHPIRGLPDEVQKIAFEYMSPYDQLFDLLMNLLQLPYEGDDEDDDNKVYVPEFLKKLENVFVLMDMQKQINPRRKDGFTRAQIAKLQSSFDRYVSMYDNEDIIELVPVLIFLKQKGIDVEEFFDFEEMIMELFQNDMDIEDLTPTLLLLKHNNIDISFMNFDIEEELEKLLDAEYLLTKERLKQIRDLLELIDNRFERDIFLEMSIGLERSGKNVYKNLDKLYELLASVGIHPTEDNINEVRESGCSECARLLSKYLL